MNGLGVQYGVMLKTLSGVLIILGFLQSPFCYARSGARLVVIGDNVTVFSGPSFRYRPLAAPGPKTSFVVSQKRVQSPDGEFYKVLVVFSGSEKKRVGYISVRENVRLERSESDEDIESYQSLALANSALQAGFIALKDSNYMWSLGYLKYPAPSFYLKGFVGQLLTKTAASPTLGGEIGFDQLAYGAVSVYASFAAGFLFVPDTNVLFAGSKSLNYLAVGGTGLRYNAGEFAAVSVGMIQSAFLNPNNSFVSLGLGFTLEVGL